MIDHTSEWTKRWSQLDWARVKNAWLFAQSGHAGQDYGGGGPGSYFTHHVKVVAELCLPYGVEPVIVGFLHDVLEDTSITALQIRVAFGDQTADRVELLSDSQVPGLNRRQRKAESHARLRVSGDGPALIAKAADRLANVESAAQRVALQGKDALLGRSASLLEMYRKEHPAFREAAHRVHLCDHIWARLDALLER